MRSFTIAKVVKSSDKSKIDYEGGRFKSDTPIAAAKKAYAKVHGFMEGKVRSMKIVIKETTRGSDHKEYKYRVSRKLQKKNVTRGGTDITYTYKTKIKSI
jgi:hypothetical protein